MLIYYESANVEGQMVGINLDLVVMIKGDTDVTTIFLPEGRTADVNAHVDNVLRRWLLSQPETEAPRT